MVLESSPSYPLLFMRCTRGLQVFRCLSFLVEFVCVGLLYWFMLACLCACVRRIFVGFGSGGACMSLCSCGMHKTKAHVCDFGICLFREALMSSSQLSCLESMQSPERLSKEAHANLIKPHKTLHINATSKVVSGRALGSRVALQTGPYINPRSRKIQTSLRKARAEGWFVKPETRILS